MACRLKRHSSVVYSASGGILGTKKQNSLVLDNGQCTDNDNCKQWRGHTMAWKDSTEETTFELRPSDKQEEVAPVKENMREIFLAQLRRALMPVSRE